MKTPKISALIPARSGSKRVLNKNVRMLGGKPLMVWSIEAATSVGWPCWVSTDSHEYGKISFKAGANVMMRPPELCDDKAGDLEVIKHSLKRIDSEYIAYLRPTTPFRDPKVLKNSFEFFLVSGATGMRSVEIMSESAFKCFTFDDAYLRPILDSYIDWTDLPNQWVRQTFKPNGYIDIVRREVIEAGSLWGDKKIGFVTPRSIEIDTEEDFEFAEWKLNRRVYDKEKS